MQNSEICSRCFSVNTGRKCAEVGDGPAETRPISKSVHIQDLGAAPGDHAAGIRMWLKYQNSSESSAKVQLSKRIGRRAQKRSSSGNMALAYPTAWSPL